MYGIHAHAPQDYPGGPYDRFAQLMGILASEPNHRREIENNRMNADRDYELKKKYYDILAAKEPAGQDSLAWKQSVEQNPAPEKDIVYDPSGNPVVNDATGMPYTVEAGTPNYLPAFMNAGTSDWFGSGRTQSQRTPDTRQTIADTTRAKQMEAYLAATGHPIKPTSTPNPTGQAPASSFVGPPAPPPSTYQSAITPTPPANPYTSTAGPDWTQRNAGAQTAPAQAAPEIDPVLLANAVRKLSPVQQAEYNNVLSKQTDPTIIKQMHQDIIAQTAALP